MKKQRATRECPKITVIDGKIWVSGENKRLMKFEELPRYFKDNEFIHKHNHSQCSLWVCNIRLDDGCECRGNDGAQPDRLRRPLLRVWLVPCSGHHCSLGLWYPSTQPENYLHNIVRRGRPRRKVGAISFATSADEKMLFNIQKFYKVIVEELPSNVADVKQEKSSYHRRRKPEEPSEPQFEMRAPSNIMICTWGGSTLGVGGADEPP